MTPASPPPWRVSLGASSKPELLRRLAAAGVRLNPLAQRLFDDDRFGTLASPVVVECVPRSVAALGLADGGTFDGIAAAAAAQGLRLCPLELAPQLRLQLHDQPEAAADAPAVRHRAPPGSITVASAPLDDDDDTPKGFYLRRVDGVLWLRGYTSWPGHVWSPADVLVFALPARSG